MASDVVLRNLAVGDAGWLIQQHGVLYAEEEGFDPSFEALVAEILADYIRNHDPTCERAWIAWRGNQRLGSIFCVRGGAPDLAKLRLFLLTPEARGQGLGQRMLTECLTYARTTGYRQMTLWTHESHKAACALYTRNGFVLESSKAVTSFGVRLIEQQWSLHLTA